MVKRFLSILATLLFVAGTVVPSAQAGLVSVSGINGGEVLANGDPANVALFPANGQGANFPLWYKDTNGLKLGLCLEGAEGEFPCAKVGTPYFANAQCTTKFYPHEEVVGFGLEGYYFLLLSYPFDVPLTSNGTPTGTPLGGSVQLQLLLETTWGADERYNPATGQVNGQTVYTQNANGACVTALSEDIGELHRVEAGYELLFARLRLRVLPGSPEGWYRMTYPYGVKTIYFPFDGDLNVRTEVRQLVGDLDASLGPANTPNYTIALNDPQTLIAANGGTVPAQYIGLRETGFASDAAFGTRSVGPFLHHPNYLTDPEFLVNGKRYIGRPTNEANPALAPGHPITGSTFDDPLNPGQKVNFFRVQFLAGEFNAPPAEAAWTTAPVVAYTDQFNLVGQVVADPPVVAPTPASIGVFRNGVWYLDTSGDGAWGAGDTQYRFGIAGDLPVTGDWNGDGFTQIGMFRNGVWYLDTSGDGVWGAGDTQYRFGIAGDIPVIGDWNGNGQPKIGVFRNGGWYLDTSGDGVWGAGDTQYRFGVAGDIPLTGGGDVGADTIAVFRNAAWYIDDNNNGIWDAGLDTVVRFGIAGDKPVVGDWNGSGDDKVGVFRNGVWYLDINGSDTWDNGVDSVLRFGIAGDRPVTGRW
jgi:hypothetical protein